MRAVLFLALLLCIPTPEEPPMPEFVAHEVAKFPNGYQIAVADMNGDGKPDLLALSTAKNRVVWYENPSWKEHAIITTLPAPITVAPAPGGQEIAIATDFALSNSTTGGRVWLLHPPKPGEEEWQAEQVDAIPSSHRLRWADLNGDGKPVLVNAPLLGYGAKAPDYAVPASLVWYSHEGAKWSRHVIDDHLRLFHGFAVVKWDAGERRDSVLTASAEGVHLFRSHGQGANLTWTKQRISDSGASEVCLGHLGRRRFLATIEPWHGDEVVVYNDTQGGWSRQVIDSSFNDGHALVCGDFNGDGRDEIVAGYRGKGTSLYAWFAKDTSGREWQRVTVDDGGMSASGCVIADLNGDGRPDVACIGASTGSVKWYELK